MLKKLSLLAVLLIACVSNVCASAPPWPDAPYSYYGKNTSLQKTLREFATDFSLDLEISPNVSGTVNGNFNAKNPTEFITRMGGVYGFSWFTHGGSLFISKANEALTKAIPAPSSNVASLKQALTDLGVLESKFGWGELPEQGVALVSGPAAYIRIIENTIASLPAVVSGLQVAIFRLKYAPVDDRTVTFRETKIVTPGVATILRNLIAGTSRGGNAETFVDVAPARTPGTLIMDTSLPMSNLAGNNDQAALANANRDNMQPNGQTRAASSGRGRSAPSVQADIRMNAVVVQDIPERIPIYERLIAQLDIPTALIEIEAMIIDVNTQKLAELGISWEARFSSSLAGYGLAESPNSATSLRLSLLTASGLGFISRIRALEQLGDAQIQSRPSIITTDNLGALIELSETFYVQTTGERVATVTPVTASTSLRVVPRFIPMFNGSEQAVQLAVDIEDGQIQDQKIDQLPTVRKSTLSTQAVVKENETLLIGGYNTNHNIQSNSRVPGLGGLPLIGALFSNKSRDIQNRERLFLIKPRIVNLPINVAQELSNSLAKDVK